MNRPSAKQWAAASVLFVALTVAMTWPFAARLTKIDAGDSAFFAWAVGFQVHAVRTDPFSLPHGNFYAPSRFTFFMDEPVLGTGLLVLPLSFFTDDAILLFNLARLLTFVLTGLFTWRLGRDLGFENGTAIVAGAFFAFSPIRVDQIAHLSTLGTQWIPLVFLFARRFCVEPSLLDAARTGFFFALSFLACGYHGLFFAVLLPLAMIPFLATPRARAIVSMSVGAILVAAVLLYPLYDLTTRALGPLTFSRSTADTLKYAASLETFLTVSRWNRVWGPLTEDFRADPSNLFPGLVVAGLALAGLIREMRQPVSDRRRFVHCLAHLGLFAALLALGPEIRWRGTALMPGPFALLRDFVPVFANIRATARAGIFMAFALAILAGYALQSMKSTRFFAAGALSLFLVEARIAPIPAPSWADVIDSRDPVPAVDLWLKDQPRGTVIAELPAHGAGDYSRPAFHDSIYMVRSTRHWLHLVNGFAGAETKTIGLFRATAPSFPSAASLAVLDSAQTKYVVVHMRGYGPNQRERLVEGLSAATRLREAARFVNGDVNSFDVDVVYELLPPRVEAGPVAPRN